MKVRIPQQNAGGPANMQAMIKQAQKMQEDMAAKQAELEEREYEISAGGGVVGVKINGKKEILSVKIDPEVVDPDDVETLEDLIVAAVNEAVKTVENTAAEEMQKITGSLGLGGMGGLGGMF
ncbi:MAG: YbaB/EbfC family nucleoid-associated protein [Clostridia bacterium]|nr:YbaB/EbfC family nucleoid-associated protein [Clostridia bacterium]